MTKYTVYGRSVCFIHAAAIQKYEYTLPELTITMKQYYETKRCAVKVHACYTRYHGDNEDSKYTLCLHCLLDFCASNVAANGQVTGVCVACGAGEGT